MAMLADTLTTRDALRRAICDDIVGRADIEATTIEGGPLDGIQVISLGKLRDVVVQHLQVELPPPTDKYAEVSTPATIATSTICPECRQPTEIVVKLHPRLTVEGNSTELAVKAKSKSVPHMHGQLPLGVPEGQETLEDAVGAIDDLRLRILRAVADVSDAWGGATDPGEPPTLDAIARKLELASESDRGDLEESLYAYAQLDVPLVEIDSGKGKPTQYVLTEAGIALVEEADGKGDDEPITGAGVEGEVVDEEEDDKDGAS